jgi:hypothetical protein
MVVKAKIEDVFPQLTGIGEYEFLRVLRSKRDLITIPAIEKGYDVKTIKTAIGSGKLYLRPVQASIELHESVVNLNCMSKEKCRNCDLMVYLHLLKDHRQDCLKSKATNVALTNVVILSLSVDFGKKLNLIFIMHNLKQFEIHYQKVQPVI